MTPLFLIFLAASSLVSASPRTIANFIKIPPQGQEQRVGYHDLTCTETDRKNIGLLIKTMAENGKLNLLFRSNELKRIGSEINHVHPLKFLGAIFSDPDLKACMKNIRSDYFKWTSLMDGLGPGLTNQADQGKLALYLEDFAKEVGVPTDALQGYVESKDWENLVWFLMRN